MLAIGFLEGILRVALLSSFKVGWAPYFFQSVRLETSPLYKFKRSCHEAVHSRGIAMQSCGDKGEHFCVTSIEPRKKTRLLSTMLVV